MEMPRRARLQEQLQATAHGCSKLSQSKIGGGLQDKTRQSPAPEFSGFAARGEQDGGLACDGGRPHHDGEARAPSSRGESLCVGIWGDASLNLHLLEVGNRGDEGRFPADVSPKVWAKE